MSTNLIEKLQPLITEFVERITEVVHEEMRAHAFAHLTAALGGTPTHMAPEQKPRSVAAIAKVSSGPRKTIVQRDPKPEKAKAFEVTCSKCSTKGHNARSCGREPRTTSYGGKAKKPASDDEDHGAPVDPRIAMIAAAVERREEDGMFGAVVVVPTDALDKRELCPVHGWVGRARFQSERHAACEEPVEVFVAPPAIAETGALPVRSNDERRDPSVPRKASTSAGRLTLQVREDAIALVGFTMPERPRTRGECPTERPCPWMGCRYHLALDVTDAGSIQMTFPDRDIEDLAHTCALDVADMGEQTLDVVGRLMNVSRERIRQIETRTFPNAMASANALGIDREIVVEGFGHAEGFPDEGATSGDEHVLVTRRKERAAKKAA